MKQIKTILCGTGYGAVYLPLLAGLPEFEFKGIFSRGSERSQQFAQRLAVPSYTTIDSLPRDVELAIIAIDGERGVELAEHFLMHQSNVLIEHPVSPESYLHLSSLAREYSQILFVNSHFRYTTAIAKYIELIKGESSAPNSVVVSASSRTLFSTLDVVFDCFGLPQAVQPLSQTTEGYQQWLIQTEQCPVLLNYQSWQGDDDTGDDVCMGHGIQAFYAQKSLQLANSWGPVIEQNQPSQNMNGPLVQVHNELTDTQAIYGCRRMANLNLLRQLIAVIEGQQPMPYEQTAQHLEQVTSMWQNIKSADLVS